MPHSNILSNIEPTSVICNILMSGGGGGGESGNGKGVSINIENMSSWGITVCCASQKVIVPVHKSRQ